MNDQDREIAAECISDMEKVKKLLDDAPHRVARDCIRLIDNVIGALGEKFPGHEYAGRCYYCEEPKGIDEVYTPNDDLICHECNKRHAWVAPEEA